MPELPLDELLALERLVTTVTELLVPELLAPGRPRRRSPNSWRWKSWWWLSSARTGWSLTKVRTESWSAAWSPQCHRQEEGLRHSRRNTRNRRPRPGAHQREQVEGKTPWFFRERRSAMPQLGAGAVASRKSVARTRSARRQDSRRGNEPTSRNELDAAPRHRFRL